MDDVKAAFRAEYTVCLRTRIRVAVFTSLGSAAPFSNSFSCAAVAFAAARDGFDVSALREFVFLGCYRSRREESLAAGCVGTYIYLLYTADGMIARLWMQLLLVGVYCRIADGLRL